MTILSKVRAATRQLCTDVERLSFGPPVSHVYNPLVYARRTHDAYLAKWGSGKIRILFLGMNPGPFGMAQTGVPFGEISWVRDWLGVEDTVDRPKSEHPKRPIEGFACTRSEVSGTRLWGAVAEHWGTPEKFFRHHFVANYCPLAFMTPTGSNLTPNKLAPHEREPLFSSCDRYLARLVDAWQPDWVVGVGAFAAQRAERALAEEAVQIATILHPSPANPRANRGWSAAVTEQMRTLKLCSE